MEAHSVGTARIRHRETGQIHEIDPDLLDWEIVGGDERQMGPELHHEAVVEHPERERHRQEREPEDVGRITIQCGDGEGTSPRDGLNFGLCLLAQMLR